MFNLESIVELKILANGSSLPLIDNYSMVLIDKYDYFEIGVINLVEQSNLIEIYCFGNLYDINEKASDFLHRNFPRQKAKESVFFLKNNAVKTIFKDYIFNRLESTINESENEIILIDSGMLEYGIIKNDVFENRSDFKDYFFIKSFLYNIIEAYDEEILECENQIMLKVPEELNSIIKSSVQTMKIT